MCIPGTPLFARLVPLGELATGLALIVGFWTRMAAIVGFLMVLNFHFATSAFWSIRFLERWNRAAGPRRLARDCHQRVAAAVQRREKVMISSISFRPVVSLMHAAIDVVG